MGITRATFPRRPAGAMPRGIWNRMVAAIENATKTQAGGAGGYSGETIGDPGAVIPPSVQLIEMRTQLGPSVPLDFQMAQAHPVYYDRDHDEFATVDDTVPRIQTVSDAFGGIPLDKGQRIVTFTKDGKQVPINPPPVRLLKTWRDGGGDYPDEDDCPTIYPYIHITPKVKIGYSGEWDAALEFEPFGGAYPHGARWKEGSTEANRAGFVFNLAGGGFYIPEGTIVLAFFVNGGWYTYWVGVEVCMSSSSITSRSSTSHLSSTTTASTTASTTGSSGGMASSTSSVLEQSSSLREQSSSVREQSSSIVEGQSSVSVVESSIESEVSSGNTTICLKGCNGDNVTLTFDKNGALTGHVSEPPPN